MRAYGGEIRSFDGDRVMAVFIGDFMSTHATNCAREIFWTTEKIIQIKASEKFNSVKNNDVKIRQACGIDVGTVRAVRAGIRNNNDLIWIGRAPSLSAKLSDNREYPYCTYITKTVFNRLSDNAKTANGNSIWEERNFNFAGKSEAIFRSSWMKSP
jgi:class 3 adenylate cyclase